MLTTTRSSPEATGAGVFTLHNYVIKQMHITGTYTGSSSNFVIWIGPPNVACGSDVVDGCSRLVNYPLGFMWDIYEFDGTYTVPASPGAQVNIVNSTGVNWTFTEVR